MVIRVVGARSLSERLGDWRVAGPAYRDLADRIGLLAVDGQLAAGTRLPAERELASALGLSRTTVAAAYRELRDRGQGRSLRGSGTTLSAGATVSPAPDGAAVLDVSRAAFPAVSAIGPAAAAAVARLPEWLADDGYEPLGLVPLRHAIAQRYTEAGLVTSADQIMVTMGAQHAINLVARALLARGDRALIESPTYPHAQEALLAAGARLGGVPVSAEDGWDLDAAAQAFERERPALAYLMPELHNPTGATMTAAERTAIVDGARRHGTVLVIDETAAELGVDGRRWPPLALEAENAGAEAITIGSLSKVAWGGLRIGWVRADEETISRLLRARPVGDLGTPVLEQLIALELFPILDDVIAERRAFIRNSRDRIEAIIAERFPEWHLSECRGGLTFWVGLGRPVSSALAWEARRHGLILVPGPRFGQGAVFERFLRVPLSISEATIDAVFDAIEAAWKGLPSAPVPATETAMV